MSLGGLVAYGSSDESENEEEDEQPQIGTKSPATTVSNVNKNNDLQLPAVKTAKSEDPNGIASIPGQTVNTNTKLHLPTPKTEQVSDDLNGDDIEDSDEELTPNFNALPKPKAVELDEIKEADSAPIPKKINYGSIELPPKKGKGPAKISIPSLSDFKDLDEDEEKEPGSQKIKPSKKGSGLIGALPPPKGSMILTKTTSMVPHVLTKKPIQSKPLIPQSISRPVVKKPVSQAKPFTSTLLSGYNSDSDDDNDKESSTDFFSLSTPAKIPDDQLLPMSSIDITASSSSMSDNFLENDDDKLKKSESYSNRILKNNIMDIPKEEIILKNKAEVGPKLPVPEQEYHVDHEGNVAFDDKAIEYLCGKRGVKRKNEFENIDIVEISGDDIKPDEREWLVKALTEEQVHRPLSVNSGPGGQSKKKHQITYLAHQAKAMELELKNQWAQNKANRQQTRSKYGF